MNEAPLLIPVAVRQIPLIGKVENGRVYLREGVLEDARKKFDRDVRFMYYCDTFYDNLNSEKRYDLWVGSNGSAKTTSKVMELLTKSMGDDPFRLLFLRHTKEEIKTTIYRTFVDTIRKYQLSKYFKCYDSTKDILCLSTGNIMYSSGMNDTGKLAGMNDLTNIFFDEPITIDKGSKVRMIVKDQFDDLDGRIRTGLAKGHFDQTLNPISKQYFLYKQLIDPHRREKSDYDPNDFNIVNSSYLDNPFLSDEYKNKVVVGWTGNKATYGRKGIWVNETTGNEFLGKAFNRDIHVAKLGYCSKKDVHLTFDFNNLPYQTMLAIQLRREPSRIASRNGREVLMIRVFREFCKKPPINTPEDCCRDFIETFPKVYGFVPIIFYGDASGKYSYNIYKEIEVELKKYLVGDRQDYDQVPAANPYIRTTRNLIKKILEGKFENIEIVFDESCENTIRDYETLQNAPDGFDPEPVKIGSKSVQTKGHCYSASSYFIARAFSHLLPENRE